MSDYSSNFPTQSPTFAFDAKAGKLDSRLSYSRSSGGTYMSSEKALNSENLLLHSQDFDTTWARDASLNAPTGSQTSPAGDSTAWLLTTASSGTGMPILFQNIAAPSNNTVCTYVVHLKAGTASHAYISFRGQSSSAAWALIDFASPTSPTNGGSLGSISATSVALGSSWYRVALTFNTGTISSGYPYVYIGASDGTSPDSTGRVTWTYSGETLYAWGGQLSSVNSLVYDSPTTTQISRSYSQLLKTASADAPRFEFASDGQSVGAALGLLVESQVSNLQRYGSDFASWAEVRYSTVTSNVGIAPNGLLEADLAVANSDSQLHYIYDTAAVITNGTTYTGSVYVKKAGHRYIQMTASTANFGSNQWATFDLDDGSIDSNNVTASAVSVGNGWWRIQATMTATASGTGGLAITFTNTAAGPIYPTISGNDYDGVLLWGWQLETGSSASSLANSGTSSSGVTRAADSCSLVSAPLLDNGSGGLTVEYDMRNASSTSYVLQTARSTGATNNDGVTIFNEGLFVNGAGSNTRIGNTTSNVFHKVAASWESGSQKISRDGSAVTEDTTTVVPQSGTDKLHIGTRQDGNTSINGHIRNIAIYSEPLTSTNLTTLSQL